MVIPMVFTSKMTSRHYKISYIFRFNLYVAHDVVGIPGLFIEMFSVT